MSSSPHSPRRGCPRAAGESGSKACPPDSRGSPPARLRMQLQSPFFSRTKRSFHVTFLGQCARYCAKILVFHWVEERQSAYPGMVTACSLFMPDNCAGYFVADHSDPWKLHGGGCHSFEHRSTLRVLQRRTSSWEATDRTIRPRRHSRHLQASMVMAARRESLDCRDENAHQRGRSLRGR